MLLSVLDRPGDYLGGRFVREAAHDGELRIYSPADTSDLVAVHPYAALHVDHAVEAARAAFPHFRRMGEPARRDLLRAYQERLRVHREAIALAIAREVGKPLWEARSEVDAMIGKVDLSLGEGARYTATQHIDAPASEIRHTPLGVLAVIGPFNFPGHLPNGQIVPALLLGNTVVHKPSERAPSAATWMAQCMHEAGFPPGVFNVVQGEAASGTRLTTHRDVDGILFTGSVHVGRRIVRDNVDHPERLIALELGGKNVAVALDDCDVERAARAIAFSAFVTAGQRCTATSRLIVTQGVAGALVEHVAKLARELRVGHVLEDDVFMGSVISEHARENVLAAQRLALDAGFEPVVPAAPYDVRGHHGFYLRPGVHRAPECIFELPGYTDTELFGPDLAVHVVPDEEAALELAGHSRFGLAASVFTRSRDAFERAADCLRVGVLSWNRPSAGASGRLPFGGLGQSGNHRPAGILAGLACSDPVAVLLAPPHEEALPHWPGMPEPAVST
jgi:succinylglutamic semialdehyde dehydrogenase